MLAEFTDACRQYRHFSFFWGSDPKSLAPFGLADDGSSVKDRCYVKLYDELPADATVGDVPKAHRVDRAYRIYPQVFEKNFHELEYLVPFELGMAAAAVIRRLTLDRHPDQRIPLELRAIGEETGYLSPMYGGPAVSISVSGTPGTDYWPFLKNVDAALRQFSARAHWGKLHCLTQEHVARLYPRYADFVGVRRQLDPNGLLLNTHTAELLS